MSQVLFANCFCIVSILHMLTGPLKTLLQHGLSMGSQPPLGFQLLWLGVLHRLLHGLKGHSCPTMAFTTGCRGIPALAHWLPCLTPSLTLVSAGLLLSYSHSSFLAAVAQLLFPFPKFVIPEVPPPSLRGSALISSGSVLGCSVWNWLHQAQQKLLASSLRRQPCNSPSTKTLPCQSLQCITSALCHN